MALTRCSSVSRRNSGNEPEKEEDEPENKSGYVQILVRPLEQGSGGYFLKWLLRCVSNNNKESVVSPQHMGVCCCYYSGAAAVACAVLLVALYQILMCDLGILFHRVCSLLIPLFSILSAFYWLTVCLRQSWSNSSIYLFFCSCFLGELFAYIFLRDLGFGIEDPNPTPSHTIVNSDNRESGRVLSMLDQDPSQAGDYYSTSSAVLNSNFTTQPLVVVCVLLFVSTASVFSSLETTSSACVILLVSFTRFLACSSLLDMPFGLRPFLAYSCGFAGVVAAKYMEAVLKPQVKSLTTQDGKIPVIKRRKSSSSGTQIFCAQRSNRRTSLPALIQKSQSSTGFESALIGEAHGLITDMLADSNLPLHIVSGLRAVGNLLKPAETHGPFHKPRVSPLVSLTENPIYGSDNEESPFTGERPSTLPKRLRRSLPPSLIRRMSTSTWTTTTTATGMPTLEPEPCRQRTSSLRHSCDTITPGSSPSDSRSSSPSPLSNSSTILAIPKSRSLSLASVTTAQSPYQRRLSKRSVCSESAIDFNLPPLASEESKDVDDLLLARHKNVSSSLLIQKRDVTSDYDSSDSPSSSDHSDHVSTSQHVPEALTIKDLQKMSRGSLSKARNRGKHFFQETGDKEQEDNDYEEDDDDDEEENQSSAKDKKRSAAKPTQSPTKCSPISKSDNGESNLLFNPEKEVEKSLLLQISRLNEWDFPIFELAQAEGSLLLTKVAYKVFTEVGLMEMFRIPLLEFLNYFHDLECGYRNKPYHNCIHATDVLHGVYFMTTQPIPGFVQVNPIDVLSRPGYSSESDSDMPQRCFKIRQPSFMTEDAYGIMGSNFPALELLALYTASAMHDYDHPGRTNAFLVATSAPQAVLYNDRSVLENHHAASSWSLLLQNPKNFFISTLDAAEFKRFRYLVIESILATDLKRHFEILAEFNAKVNDDDAPGIDWTQETDRLLVSQMVIKLADINGPAKDRDLHQQWTVRIAEEFYEQGDEEASLGLPISPYMDRRNPQLAKLQETFINHLVAPLCNAMVTGGLVPGTWAQESPEEVAERESLQTCDCKDTEDDTDNDTDNELGDMCEKLKVPPRKVNCLLTKHLKENYDYWIGVMKSEEEELKKATKGCEFSSEDLVCEKTEMEPIKEESESPPLSAHGLSSTSLNSLIPSDVQNGRFEASVWTPVFEDDMSTAV